jgi:hypothetical protein
MSRLLEAPKVARVFILQIQATLSALRLRIFQRVTDFVSDIAVTFLLQAATCSSYTYEVGQLSSSSNP